MRALRVLALAPLVAIAVACSAGSSANEGFGLIHVGDLVTLRTRGGVTVLDANGADFRTREGVIPGAVLLSSYKAYDVEAELPHDKATPLVFYCADGH